MPRINIKLEGIQYLLERLNFEHPIYAEPWKEALRKATEILRQRTKARAPRKSGRLAASVTGKLAYGRMPKYGIVTASAENKGFRYPFALNYGKGKKLKSGGWAVTHYKGTGKKTKGWFSGASRGIRKEIEQLLANAAKQIESKWQH